MTTLEHLKAYRKDLAMQLSQELAAVNQKYDAKLKALDVLLQDFPDKGQGTMPLPLQTNGESKESKGLPAAVREAIAYQSGIMGGMGGNFSSVSILDYIQKHYPKLAENKAAGHISAPLWLLANKGEIEVVTKGARHNPSIYRKTAKFKSE